MKAYSLDLRERVMAAYDEGHSVPQLATRFKVGVWWIYKIKRQRRKTGSLAPRKGRVGRPRALRAKQEQRLARFVDKHADATLAQIRARLALPCSTVALHHTLRRLGYRYKKNVAGRRTRSR